MVYSVKAAKGYAENWGEYTIPRVKVYKSGSYRQIKPESVTVTLVAV